jgi:hypothetical protein
MGAGRITAVAGDGFSEAAFAHANYRQISRQINRFTYYAVPRDAVWGDALAVAQQVAMALSCACWDGIAWH